VVQESEGMHNEFPGDFWIHLFYGYLEVYFLKIKVNFLNNHKTTLKWQ
jgi:hypothetical protein